VAAADVNGDGIDDLLAGARDADGIGDTVNNSGEVHILFGRDGLPSSRDLIKDTSDVVINGSDAGDSLGFTVASGDVYGDHIADIVAGAPVADSCGNARPDGGDAYVILGRDQWPSEISLKGAADLTFLGKKAGDETGFSAATTDFNGDGTADTVLGALQADGPNDSRPDAGELYIVFSKK